MYKKIISIILVLTIILCFAGCGKPSDELLQSNGKGTVLSKYSVNEIPSDAPPMTNPDTPDVTIPSNYLFVSNDMYAEINENSEIVGYHKLVFDEQTNKKIFKPCDAEGNVIGDNVSIVLKSLKINQTSVTLNVGNMVGLTVATDPVDYDINKGVWKSSNENVATVEKGVITAKSQGTSVISLTVGELKSECVVTVNKKDVPSTEKPTESPTQPKPTEPKPTEPKPTEPKDIYPTGITLSKTNVSVQEGSLVSISATVSPSNATNKTVFWSSSNNSVVTVSNGNIVGKSVGTATITAKTSNGKTATCRVTVTAQNISTTNISLNKTNLSLYTGDSTSLTATVSPSNATNKSVTWTTSNSSVATVSNGKVTAKGVGKATITAKSSGGQTATCTVTVTKKQAAFSWTKINQTDCPLSVSNQFDNYILSSSAKNLAIVNGDYTYIMLKASGSNKISVSSVTEGSGGKITVKYSNSGSSNCVFVKINRATTNIVYVR